MSKAKQQLSPVFVYGSLKHGFHNFRMLQKSMYVGPGVTTHPNFDMYSYGMFPAVCEGSHKISGELFAVTDQVLNMLDQLEGVDQGFYSRTVQDITLDNGKEMKAYMYMIRKRSLEQEFVEPYENIDNNIKTWLKPTPDYLKDLNTKRNMKYLKYTLMLKHGNKLKSRLTVS